MRVEISTRYSDVKRRFAVSGVWRTFLIVFATVLCSEPLIGLLPSMASNLTPAQAGFIDRAIARERALPVSYKGYSPLVETYIQDMRTGGRSDELPQNDHYILSRLDLGQGLHDATREAHPRTMKGTAISCSPKLIAELTTALGLKKLTNPCTGFMQLISLNSAVFDRQHYAFSYETTEFLGTVRSSVYDVRPLIPGVGRFEGRLWIGDEAGVIGRIDGSYEGIQVHGSPSYSFHFDTWRMNLQPGLWLPVAIYVEVPARGHTGQKVDLRAQIRFWGYSSKLTGRVSFDEDALAEPNGSVAQSEVNVLRRLVEAGIVAPARPGGYESTVLDPMLRDFGVSNEPLHPNSVHCRILLTETLEATTFGNTILVSKGLIDTSPSREVIASVVAVEFSHIALGHQTNTQDVFDDRRIFPYESIFQRINLSHSAIENTAAAKKAIELLRASIYGAKLTDAGRYFVELSVRGKTLKALNTPQFGDSMLTSDGSPWLVDLEDSPKEANSGNIWQAAALPLNSLLGIDPWSDQVNLLNGFELTQLDISASSEFKIVPQLLRSSLYSGVPTSPTQRPHTTHSPAKGPSVACPFCSRMPSMPAGPSHAAPEPPQPSKSQKSKPEVPGPEGGTPGVAPKQPQNP